MDLQLRKDQPTVLDNSVHGVGVGVGYAVPEEYQ